MSEQNFSHYIIVDEVAEAVEVIELLKRQNIQDNDIGVISKDPKIALADLPEADFSEKSQLPEALRRGALLGSASGLLAGVLLSVFPAAGVTLGGAAILGMTAGGGVAGAWSASMIGISEDSPLVSNFETSIEEQKTLILFNGSSAQANLIFNDLRSEANLTNVVFGEVE